MSEGLKNLQTAARSCARRERLFGTGHGATYSGAYGVCNDSAVGLGDDVEIEHEIDGASERSGNPGFYQCAFPGKADSKGEVETMKGSVVEFPSVPNLRLTDFNEHTARDSTISVATTSSSGFWPGMGPTNRSSISTAAESIVEPVQSIQLAPAEPGCNHRRGVEEDSSAKNVKILANTLPLVGEPEIQTLSINDTCTDSPCADCSEYESESEPDVNDSHEPSLAARQFLLSLTVTGMLRQKLICQLARLTFSQIGGIQEGSLRKCPISSGSESSTPSSSTRTNTNGNTSHDQGILTHKRMVHKEDSDDDQDHEEGKKRPRREPPEPSVTQTNRVGFSCPYHKLDPQNFGTGKKNAVCGGNWPNIGKLK